jgi:hypothetical protein
LYDTAFGLIHTIETGKGPCDQQQDCQNEAATAAAAGARTAASGAAQNLAEPSLPVLYYLIQVGRLIAIPLPWILAISRVVPSHMRLLFKNQ